MAESFGGQDASIFKYRSFGTDGSRAREFARRLVVDGEGYFAPPSVFNDVYEGLPTIVLDLPEAVQNAAREKGKLQVGPITMELDIDALLQSTGEWFIAQSNFEAVLATLLDEEFGVFCASRTPRSLQQWAYYGDNHCGLCVEMVPDEAIAGYHVTYSSLRPRVEFSSLVNSADREAFRMRMLEFLLTKASDWDHERELRFIRTSPGAMRVGSVKRIYLGCRTDDTHEAIVRQWLGESKRPQIPVERLLRDNRTYSLVTADERPKITFALAAPPRFETSIEFVRNLSQFSAPDMPAVSNRNLLTVSERILPVVVEPTPKNPKKLAG